MKIQGFKRSFGIAAVVCVSCGALQAAAPTLGSTHELPKANARVVQRVVPALHRAGVRAAEARTLSFEPARAERAGRAERRPAVLPEAPSTDAEVDVPGAFEPWSLIAGAFGVMVFLAGRRRPE